MKRIACLLTIFLLFNACEQASTEKLSKNDYDRAVSFLYENVNHRKALNLQIDPYWFRENYGFWYAEYEGDAKVFKQYLFEEGEPSEFFDHEAVADQLSELLDKNVDPYQLPFDWLWQRDRKSVV